MDLSTLKPSEGSVKTKKRVGRGQGSGRGGTSTRGHKGAKSRSGYSQKFGFEGGQMPIQRRVPKKGFKNINRVEYKVFGLSQLQAFADKHKTDTIDVDTLYTHKAIKKTDRVKILANGEVTSKLNVSVHAISAKAEEAIVNAGGTFTKI